MEYEVKVGCSWQTNDMGIANNGTYMRMVATEKLVPGYNLFEILGKEMRVDVISFKEGKLVFRFFDDDEPVTVTPGHIWHSPVIRMDNPYLYEAESYLVSIKEKQTPTDEEKTVKRILTLIKRMRKNAKEDWHPVWKNIPLAREMYELLNKSFPIEGQHIDATGIMACCDAIFLEDLLNTRDVPRLCLEFLQLRKLAMKAQTADDEPIDSSHVLGVPEADRIQNELDFYIDPTVTMEWWVDYVNAHLLFDPVERTPQWEEIIYKVEKECDRRLKEESRCMGFCFEYWSVKRAVLAKYGIDWSSPSTMNPGVMFD